jgi:hypothetical protein
MALTEQRLRTIDAPTAPSQQRLPRAWAIGLGVAWLVLFPLGVFLEPAPTNMNMTWIDAIVGNVLLVSFTLLAVGLATRRRWAPLASVGASGLVLTASFACPATGHHLMGLWWFGQLAIALTLVTLSSVAAWRFRRV